MGGSTSVAFRSAKDASFAERKATNAEFLLPAIVVGAIVLWQAVPAWAKMPENLAAKAKASASSAWGDGYEAPKAVDGDPATRWNSRGDDKDGCWIELAWEKPVRFDRVVIDECMDFGPRIQAWRLLAGSEDLAEVARGTDVGPGRTVRLAQPVEARRLRLVVEKASVVPTIWEIEVQCIHKAP